MGPHRPGVTAVIWSADRTRRQGHIVDGLYRQAAGVPAERRAVLAGGLRGADKGAALDKAGVDRARYLTISVDGMLAELARRSLIPVVAGRAPLEGAELVHAEAQHVAKRLAARAMAVGTNVLLDVTAASWPSVRSWLHVADLAAYTLDVVIVEVSDADAVRWADGEHYRGQEAYPRSRPAGRRHQRAAVGPAHRAPEPAPAGCLPGRGGDRPGDRVPGRPADPRWPGPPAPRPAVAERAADLPARRGGGRAGHR
jgi:hypothetical protein